MSNVSHDRLNIVMAYCGNHGDGKTLENFNITKGTLDRYKRKFRFFETKQPKVLIFDVETFPLKLYAWGIFKQTVSPDFIISDSAIISWSAKWLFEADIMGDVLTQEEAVKRDDSRIIKSIWKLMESADIVIAHNAIKFDVRVLNARFILNGLKPTSPYQVIDTLQISRKYFRFTSHRLDYLGKLFTNKGKIETNFGLWRGCDNGDQESLDSMLRYNKGDVSLLEEVYLELRPWMRSHPNMAIYKEASEEMCPTCGSDDVVYCGEYYTPAGRFDSLRCVDCGGISRRRKSNLSRHQKDNLLISTAR